VLGSVELPRDEDSSVGSVTVAVPLLVAAISFLLLLEVLQHSIQLAEPLRPGALVVLHQSWMGYRNLSRRVDR